METIEELKEEIKDLEEEIDDLEKENKKLEKENTELEKENYTSEIVIEMLEEDIVYLKERLIKLLDITDIDKIKTKLMKILKL